MADVSSAKCFVVAELDIVKVVVKLESVCNHDRRQIGVGLGSFGTRVAASLSGKLLPTDLLQNAKLLVCTEMQDRVLGKPNENDQDAIQTSIQLCQEVSDMIDNSKLLDVKPEVAKQTHT